MAQGQRHREPGTFSQPAALGNDLPEMLLDNPVADRQAKPRALTSATASKKWLKQVLHDIFRHPTTVVGHDQLSLRTFGRYRNCDRPTRLDTVEPVRNQVQYDLL